MSFVGSDVERNERREKNNNWISPLRTRLDESVRARWNPCPSYVCLYVSVCLYSLCFFVCGVESFIYCVSLFRFNFYRSVCSFNYYSRELITTHELGYVVPTNYLENSRHGGGARLAGMRVQARRIRTEDLVRLSIIEKRRSTHSCDTVHRLVDRSHRTRDKFHPVKRRKNIDSSWIDKLVIISRRMFTTS